MPLPDRFPIPLSIRTCGFPAYGLLVIFLTWLRCLPIADRATELTQAVPVEPARRRPARRVCPVRNQTIYGPRSCSLQRGSRHPAQPARSPTNRGQLLGAPVPTQAGLTPAGLVQLSGRDMADTIPVEINGRWGCGGDMRVVRPGDHSVSFIVCWAFCNIATRLDFGSGEPSDPTESSVISSPADARIASARLCTCMVDQLSRVRILGGWRGSSAREKTSSTST